MRKLLLAIAGLLLAASAAHAGFLMLFSNQSTAPAGGTTYYIDSAIGNNSNSGTSPSTAWLDLTNVNAHTTYHPGDKVLLNGGQTFASGVNYIALVAANYTTNPPTEANPLTISTYGTGVATLNLGSTTAHRCILIQNIAAISISNITCTGTGAVPAPAVWIDNNLSSVQLHGVTINNLTITNFHTDAFDIGGDVGTSGFTDVLVTNSTAANTTGSGFITYGGGTVPVHHNVVFSNLIAHDNTGAASTGPGAGIVLGDVTHGSILNSIAYNNGAGNTHGPVGIWAYQSDHVLIEFNESYNNSSANTVDGDGYDFDLGINNSTMCYNYSHGNKGAGYLLDAGTITAHFAANTLCYNISQNDAAGRTDQGGITLANNGGTWDSASIFNNVIYQSSATGAAMVVGVGSGTNIAATLSNNIFQTANNAKLFFTNSVTPVGMTFLGNNYCSSAAGACGGTFSMTWGATNYTSLAAWASAASQEAGATAIQTDYPKLTSAGGGGTTNGYNPGNLSAYTLASGSPMFGVGQAIASPSLHDYFGNVVPSATGTGYNIGADGSNSAAQVPAAPVITAPTTGSTVVTAITTVSGQGSANTDTINATVDGVTTNGVATVTSGAWSFNTAALANGSHTISATETNVTGTSLASNSVTYTTALPANTPVTSLHYGAQDNNGTLGFNLADVSSVSVLDALPAGYKGLAYLGLGGSNGCVNATDPTFIAAVSAYAPGGVVDPRLWGFYITDEPLVANCTTANLKSDVDYIHANFPGVQTFVILENLVSYPSVDFSGYLTPANSDLDYVGLDPYPVRTSAAGGFDLTFITNSVPAAEAVGWTLSQLVPVYQAFGNYDSGDWNLPTLAQENQILQTWGSLTPTPIFDYAYSYGVQCPGGTFPCDLAIANTPYLQTFYQQRNGIPPAPSISGPTTTSTTAIVPITGNGTTSTDTITVCIDGTFTGNACGGGGTALPATTVASNTTWTVNTGSLGNGAHTATAIETNAKGFSLASSPFNFNVQVAVVTNNILDTTKTTPSITLTPDNLTSSVTAAGSFPQSLSTNGYTTGKYHFELQLTGSGNTFQGTGIANGSHLLTAGVGNDTNSIALYTGEIFYNNAAALTNAGLTVNAGNLVAIEVDLGAGLFWAKNVTTGGTWNGNGSNPATGTGGISFSTAGSPTWYVADAPVAGVVAGRSQTVNFGASNFSAACSVGFLAWNGTSTACPSPPVPPTFTTPPSPANGSTVSTASVTLGGGGQTPGDTITLNMDGSNLSPTTAVAANGTWSFITANLSNALHSVYATETNAAGTSQHSSVLTFTTNATVVTTYTWDSAKTATSLVTLDATKLISTVSTGGGIPYELSTVGYPTGKYHFELQLTGAGGTAQGLGLATAGYIPPSASLGQDTAGFSISLYGNVPGVYYKNVQQISNSGLAVAAGDLLAVEVDIGAGKYWVKDVTSGSGWNGTVNGDPGAGTGGVAFTNGGSTWFAATLPPNAVVGGRSTTANFGASTFGAQCSTGYLAWNGTSTACPAVVAGPGPGTVAPVSLLPSDLPTTHWQTTARPWSALNVPASSYLTRANNMASWLFSNVNSDGCINSATYANGWQTGAPTDGAGNGQAAFAAGYQISQGNTANQAKGILAMNCDSAAYRSGAVTPDFALQLNHIAYGLLKNISGAPASTWASNLNFIPTGIPGNTNNWVTYDMEGFFEGQKNSFSAYSGTNTQIEGWWCQSGSGCLNGTNQSSRMATVPWHLYEDSTDVPDSLAVERVGGANILLMVDRGYAGASAGAMATASTQAALTDLLIQSPSGGGPTGGRQTDHPQFDALYQLTFDIMAQRIGVSNSFLAGQYQHAAELMFNEAGKYLIPSSACCGGNIFFPGKNHWNPALGIGQQFGSVGAGDIGYNNWVMQTDYFLSHQQRLKSAITEKPAPSEIGGYAFSLPRGSSWNQAFVNGGGTLAQIALAGQTAVANGQVWSSIGINRIARVGWEERIGPLDGAWPSVGNGVNFGPTWNTSGGSGGAWTRLAQNPSSCSGAFTSTFANPALSFGKVVWTCGSIVFTQNLTVDPDGVLSQTTCSGCPTAFWGMTAPILTNDGTTGGTFQGTTTTTSIAGNTASVTWPASGDQQNYMTLSANPTTLVQEGSQTASTGTLLPVRMWTGTGTASDATQTTFVYPRNSSDPTAANVRSGMAVTGTNTYTNSALSSSVVSGSQGTYYIGRTAAGGWANTVTLPGGTLDFHGTACFFIAQLNGSGQVTALEVDRNVTATYVGAAGTHTNVNLTAHNPVTNQ